jgi:hypothetical protein
MTREQIIEQIKRTATENGGVPLGSRSFADATGIGMAKWRGRYWRSWGDALREAGFEPNRPKEAHGSEQLLLALTKLVAKLGRFPTQAEMMLEKRTDPTFPNTNSYDKHIGRRAALIEGVREYAAEHEEYKQVLDVLPVADAMPLEAADTSDGMEGAVYMLRHGKHYKIGKSFRVPQRHREIAIELPEKPEFVHLIKTDDPAGIEAYWHKRFHAKHTNGEWFALTREDVRAFKRRRFM